MTIYNDGPPTCVDCGVETNEVFIVCDACWEKHQATSTKTSHQRELEFVAMKVALATSEAKSFRLRQILEINTGGLSTRVLAAEEKLSQVERQLRGLDDMRDTLAEVCAERDAARACLKEWLETKFFEDEDAWREWVKEFRPRVIAALGEQP